VKQKSPARAGLFRKKYVNFSKNAEEIRIFYVYTGKEVKNHETGGILT